MTKFLNFGPDTIGQYIIERWTQSDDRKNQTKERVLTLEMVLSRKLTSIIMVTYLATLLMNIINQTTNFIKVEIKVL